MKNLHAMVLQGTERLALRACTVRRSRVGALVDAWLSVRAGLSVQEHLVKQLAAYTACRPADVVGAPYALTIVDGRVEEGPGVVDPRLAVLADPAGFEATAAGDETAVLVKATRTLLEGRRNALQHDLAARQELLANMEARRRVTDETEEALRAALDGAIHTGEALPAETGRRAPKTRARPVQYWGVLLGAIVLALVWMLSNEVALVYPTFADQGGPKLLALSASIGVVVGLFLALEVVLVVAWNALHCSTALQRLSSLVFAGGAMVAFVRGAWTLAAVRAAGLQAQQALAALANGGSAPAVQVSVEEFFWFAVLIPVGLTLLTLAAKAVWNRRQDVRAAQRAWDAVEAQRREVRERADERIGLVMAQRAALEAQTEAARRSVEALSAVAQAMEAELGASVQRDMARVTAWLRSAAAALAVDRRMFGFVAQRAGVPMTSVVTAPTVQVDSGVRLRPQVRQLGGR